VLYYLFSNRVYLILPHIFSTANN